MTEPEILELIEEMFDNNDIGLYPERNDGDADSYVCPARRRRWATRRAWNRSTPATTTRIAARSSCATRSDFADRAAQLAQAFCHRQVGSPDRPLLPPHKVADGEHMIPWVILGEMGKAFGKGLLVIAALALIAWAVALNLPL